MAKMIRITYQCPRCRTDLGRRFGLIMTRTVDCPKCGNSVRVDSQVFAQNWGFNFGWVGGLLIWAGMGGAVLIDPEFAATIGGNTFPAATPKDRVIIALTCVIPAFIGGFILNGLGMLFGAIAAHGAPAGSAPVEPEIRGSPSPAPPPLGRGCLIRAFFILFWPVVFFFASGVTLALLAGFSAEGEAARKKAVQQSAEQNTGWMLLGTLLVFLLGCLGLLPWTGRKKKEHGESGTTT